MATSLDYTRVKRNESMNASASRSCAALASARMCAHTSVGRGEVRNSSGLICVPLAPSFLF